MCECCYRTVRADQNLPNDWKLVAGSALCPKCIREATILNLGYANLRGGQFAGRRKDPRDESVPTFRRPICHTLKTLPEYLDAVGSGEKTFEVRRNDRDFLNGDGLHLREWHADSGTYGPRSITCRVSYVLKGAAAIKFGVRPGFCVLGIKLPGNHQWPLDA